MRLTHANIQAAGEIRRLPELASWDDADSALDDLARHFADDTNRAHVLAKASAIDKLYSTRAGNIYWAADAVVSTMSRLRGGNLKVERGVDIVDAISQAKTDVHEGADRCASFASKYCHFFVKGWDFPIYDSFALAAVKRVTGQVERGRLTEGRSEYRDFCERLHILRARDSLGALSVREVDRFLWLWGQWLAQEGHSDAVVNTEVFSVFRSKKSAVVRLLRAMQPVA
jgi:hypothetical protein